MSFFIIWLFYFLETKPNSDIAKICINFEKCDSILVISTWKSRFDYFVLSGFEIPNFGNSTEENNKIYFRSITDLLFVIVGISTNYKCLGVDLNGAMTRSPLFQVRKLRPFISIEFRHDFSCISTTNKNNRIRKINRWITVNST